MDIYSINYIAIVLPICFNFWMFMQIQVLFHVLISETMRKEITNYKVFQEIFCNQIKFIGLGHFLISYFMIIPLSFSKICYDLFLDFDNLDQIPYVYFFTLTFVGLAFFSYLVLKQKVSEYVVLK
jgi:hypothetical protein